MSLMWSIMSFLKKMVCMYQKVNGTVYFEHAIGVLSDWVLLYR